jgi:PIN domain nuclease of toxin-antitoxin system
VEHLLLDTHAFLWWNADDESLGPGARAAIADPRNVVSVSAATAWEIATKRALGKLRAPGDIGEWIDANAFSPLPVGVGHAVRSAELPVHHRDPFVRLLVAQAQIEGLTLVTSDPDIAKYEVATLDAAA